MKSSRNNSDSEVVYKVNGLSNDKQEGINTTSEEDEKLGQPNNNNKLPTAYEISNNVASTTTTMNDGAVDEVGRFRQI